MSQTRFEISPDYRDLLADRGLDSFEALFAFREGRHIDGHRDRSVVRLVLKDRQGRDVPCYLKREWDPKLALLARRMIGNWLRFPLSRSLREWRNLRALLRRGIGAAEPMAVGEERRYGFFHRALLLVREVPEAVSLAAYLDSFPAAPTPPDLRTKRRIARDLGAFVRRMHDSGMAFHDLYAKHIYLNPAAPAGQLRPTLIDAQRAKRFPHLLPHARWLDLAALLATTQQPAVTATDRLRFILAYARQSRGGEALRLMISRVLARAGKLKGRGLDPRLTRGRHRAPPGMVPLADENLVHIDNNRIVAIERFLPALEGLGLTNVEAVMKHQGGQSFRDVPGRLTVRIPITGPDGRPSAVYLKRHWRVDADEWLDGLLMWRKPRTRAEAEYRNIVHLLEHNIATATPVAYGQALGWSQRQPSFLITEEIPGGRPADDYLKEHFGPGGSEAGHRQRLLRLIRNVAHLARHFHQAGFHHQDFYLCHIFVRELPAEGEPRGAGHHGPAAADRPGQAMARPAAGPGHRPAPRLVLHLIDLQRVRYPGPRKVGRRWLVKDLAQLNYSAPAGIITRTDKLRFLHDYLNQAEFSREARGLIREIVAKTARIARHDRRLQGRRNVQ